MSLAPVDRPEHVLVLGSINVDLVVRGPRLPAVGETVVGGDFYRAAGGKGANQAVAAARLSRGSVAFVAAVGADDLGRDSLAALQGERLDLAYVRLLADVPTGVALILVDEQGRNLISVASGANSQLRPTVVDELPEDLFRRSRVVLASLETPLDTVVRFLARGRAAGCLTVLNPAPAVPGLAAASLLPLVDVLTPNEVEAAALSGFPVSDAGSAHAAGERLREQGAASVVVTRGEHGCTWVDSTTARSEPAYPVKSVDTTAAGDAFSGALAVALAEGATLAAAIEFALHAAAISVTRRGAQPSLPRRSELETGQGLLRDAPPD
ncbi:MAG: ribokinase [Pirellulales bacterium]